MDLAEAVIRDRIEAMSDDEAILAVERAGYEFDYEVGLAVDGSDSKSADDDSRLATAIRADLIDDEHLACVIGSDRDVDILNLDGRAYLITGGLSYGDDPTDAYKWICIYAETGVTVEPIRLGAAAAGPLVARCAGITVELGPSRAGTAGAYEGGRVLESAWREPGEPARLAAALDAVERIVLAHAVAGVDVESTAYLEGVGTVLDGIMREDAE